MRYKKFLPLMTIIISFFSGTALFAQDSTKTSDKSSNIQHGQHFIDEDGDGYNDNAPDHDNDGIPNGLDPDWQGDNGKDGSKKRWRYIDLDGDGINDNIQTDKKEQTPEYQNRHGEQNGASVEGQENRGNGKHKKKNGPKK